MPTFAFISRLVFVLVALLAFHPTGLLAQTTTVVVFDDDSANGNGVFDFIGVPEAVIGNAGYATMRAQLDDTIGGLSDDFGIFQTDGNTLIEAIRQSDPAPDGNGVFRFNFNITPMVNRHGQVAIESTLEETAGDTLDNYGVFLIDNGTIKTITREGDLEPSGDGTFNTFANFALNNAGQVAVDVSLLNTPTTRNEAIYLGDGQTLIKIARENDSIPDGNSNTRITSIFEPALNDNGEVAFQALTLSGPRILKGDGTDILTIQANDQAIPGGDGEFGSFSGGISINNSGQVAFTSVISGGSSNNGLFIGDGQTTTTLALEGEPAPDGVGVFQNLHGVDEPLLNEAGQVLLVTDIDIDNSPDEEGIFRFGGGATVQIAREEQTVPGGVGTFNRFDYRSLNNSGQVAFLSNLSDTGSSNTNTGIYFYDDSLGLLQVAREGDQLLGGIIREVTFSPNTNEIGSRSGLNDSGQVAFGFRLDDFRIGVAVWTPPVSEINAQSATLFRGLQIAGQLSDLQFADDSRVHFNPGFVLNDQEAPVWLIVDGELPTDHPQNLEFHTESQAGTPGLTLTVEAWNWDQNQYDFVGEEATSFNTDSVFVAGAGANSPDYSEAQIGAVQARLGWRQTGFTINFPWEVRVDHFFWSID